jgi:hypothetical protein
VKQKLEIMNNEKLPNEAQNPALSKGAVSGSSHQMRAINTFKEMEKQLAILKQDVSFREYDGFEMCMKIFCERYKKWIVVNGNDR